MTGDARPGRRAVLALAGAALATAVAAGRPGARAARAAAGETVTDPTGRTLRLAGPPSRIVCLVPSVTEILFALGEERRLVGVTDFCDYPLAARAKPHVGGMISPSLETIAALRPDLVVATTAGNRDETFAQILGMGVPVYVVNPTSVAQALELIERLAGLVAHPEAAAPVVGALRRRVQAVAARVAARGRPRVLYVVWPDPLVVPGRSSLVSELIERAGGRSITADSGEGYPRYGVEAAVAQAPEVILLARHGPPGSPIAREQWERFAMLPAVRRGRVHDVDGNLLHRYGPRMVDGLETLARLIHPELGPDAGRGRPPGRGR